MAAATFAAVPATFSTSINEGRTMKLSARLAVALAWTLVAAGVRPADAAETNFVTDFGFNGRHAYFYVAREKGYYKACLLYTSDAADE